MHFGYFTLSDNAYAGNTRGANELVQNITDEAIYAEKIGMHSAWIGEHHFSTLGVLSCPDLVLANIAAKTSKIRLAPAVTVLPLHHPLHVAEQWATLDLLSNGRVDFATGRGYDRREYEPFGADFDDNLELFHEGVEIVQKLWNSNGPVTHKGKYYQLDNIRTTPRPVQRTMPIYIASFSKPSLELAARLGCGIIVAPFAATMAFGGLAGVAKAFHEICDRVGTKPGPIMCSYFTHFADDPASEQAARARQIRYFKECVIASFPGDPATAPPTYRYFIDMVKKLHEVQAKDLSPNAVLLGSPQQMIDTLKTAQDAGFSEVILYINVGLKPHGQVKDEMARFMEQVAPQFE
jgi:alkanesulfonate monooxygenase SsuD/methylene tetrahydromethanopterin reductase-like flavin-dependent oxidoreductase (luciferase family)